MNSKEKFLDDIKNGMSIDEATRQCDAPRVACLICYTQNIKKGVAMNKIKGVESVEQGQKIAQIIGGTFLMLNGDTAIIMGSDPSKLGA